MIPSSILFEMITAEPFQPFRIHMASGRTFEIRHPEMISVSKSNATVYLPSRADRDTDDPLQKLSLMLMESIEPLGPKPATNLGS